MPRKILSFIMALLVATVVGCGGTDEINLNQFNSNTGGNGLSGQTGTVTLQTQLANNQSQNQQVLVVQTETIPDFVDEIRFTGQDANGFFIYGPVILPKSALIDLLGVPVEVTTLRMELLVNGFTVGGLVTPVSVLSGDTVFITNPTWVFAGSTSDVLDPTVAFGTFLNQGEGGGEFGRPEGEFPIEEAPAFDFSIPQVTNGVSRTGPGLYTVTESGDYLLSYSMDIGSSLDILLTQVARNNTFVDNTRLDIADTEFINPQAQAQALGQSSSAQQSFQHIVTLAAGDVVSLRVRDFRFTRQITVNAQQEEPRTFPIIGGTFSIVRLGAGGVTGPAPPLNEG
jgi:hypothetical protein